MSAIILFDGVCNFCNGAVNFIIERDRTGYFKFAPLQSEIGEKLLAENGIDKIETDSVVLVEDGAVYTHSTAALRVARRLDGAWKWLYHLIYVPPFLRDGAYKLFAKYRYALFGKKDECMLPSPEIRARFLATN
ncbi:MAG TPA: thiol-disulfide oxidoreductase DCC family protein [Pyrinomonadaceae bacterium]